YPVAMFHLFTHAFFKAMLFLGAGSVIHATHHEQDMRNYGGLRKKIPLTFWAMMIGTLAITGVGIPLTHIGFAGFLSKDAVIESAWGGNHYAFYMLVIAAGMTSFYSWRLMFLTFFGESRAKAHDDHGHGHDDHHGHDAHGHDDHHAHEPQESPVVMLIPLGVLALGAVFAGMIWNNVFFADEAAMRSWFGMEPAAEHVMAEAGHAASATEAAPAAEPAAAHKPQGALLMLPEREALHHAHEAPVWVKVSPFVAMILGLLLAIQMYLVRPDWPAKLAANQRPLYLFLLNKWYFDEIYDFLFVQPAKWLGAFLWKRGDGAVIDGTINGIALGAVPFFTRLAARAQSGYLFHYAFAMVLGIAALLTWMTLSGGAH
ncbi:MAG: NADH-quinone oxidoreductase subunit L, partial [Rhodobacteraceae bacterium]|nr:NADH-quinone oxidoreductase subunit L [Paracoccaceae bacterium]